MKRFRFTSSAVRKEQSIFSMKALKKLGYYLAWWAVAGGFGAVLVLAAAYLYLEPKVPPAESYRNIRLQNPLRVYSADNRLIAEFGNIRRDPIKYEDIPQRLIDALIASEDTRFYSHNGVDLKAVARMVVGVLSGNDRGGASTITMQLAKNISFEGEDPYSRKFKEILLALQIERELSKKEILELYLNRIFFGISAYGVAAASQQYYNKAPDELSLAEMAMLIGILPRPNGYNPLVSEELALRFRGRVLRRMHDLGMISRQEYEEAEASAITAKRYGRQPEINAPYIAELVRLEMEARYGDLATTDGFEVYTTIDSGMQATATAALREGLEEYDRRHGYRGAESRIELPGDGATAPLVEALSRIPTVGGQEPAYVLEVREREMTVLRKGGELLTLDWDGIRWAKRFITTSTWGSTPSSAHEVAKAGDLVRVRRGAEGRWELGQVPAANGGLVAVDPNNGAIRSLVGGYDFYANSYNRVTQAQRQPGSNFKPFLYAAALENGYTAASLINDAPLARSDYRPENFNRQFLGPLRLRYALQESKNLVSLRLYDALGEDVVLPYVARFGFRTEEFPRNDLTVAIGSHAVTPLQVATGYTVFANGGHKVEPYLIDRIVNFNDGEVFRARPATVCDCSDALDPVVPAALAAAPAPDAAPALDAASGAPPEPPIRKAPRVIDERTAYIMNTILRSVITEGSGAPANRQIGRGDLYGKTGTTNDANDLWFSGFNGNLVTTVYVGFDQPQSLGSGEQAATVALPIWIDYMKAVLDGTPEKSMAQPNGIVTVRINEKTGLRARPDDPNAIFEVFREENVPAFGTEAKVLDDPSGDVDLSPNPF